MNSFDLSSFPSVEKCVRAHWAPVLLSPISGSCERLVVGVVAVNGSGYHLEIANSLDRLRCLYGADAEAVITAVQLAAKYLKNDLEARSIEALRSPDPGVTGITIGDCIEAEGLSLASVAQSWMVALSSLYSPAREIELMSKLRVTESIVEVMPQSGSGADRLPFLVCNYVQSIRGGFTNYFSSDLRQGSKRRGKGSSHSVIIDFAGPKLVANFGTLKAGAITNSVHHIKRRLWDLKIQRDQESDGNFAREHELLLQCPREDDPQISLRQHDNIKEALGALVDQADLEELRVVALPDVETIGKRILDRAA